MGFHLEWLDLNSDNFEDFLDRFIEVDDIHQSEDNFFHSIKIADFLEINFTHETQQYPWDLYFKDHFMSASFKKNSYTLFSDVVKDKDGCDWHYRYESKDCFDSESSLTERVSNRNENASVKDKIPFVLYPTLKKIVDSDAIAIDEEPLIELNHNQILAA